MEFIYWLVAIILLVLVGYGAIMYLTRQQANRIKAIDEKKQKAMAIPVADNLFTLKNMNLTGQTKRTYESWQATWQTITRFQYPEIEAALVSAEQYIQRMNFIKAKEAISQADQLIRLRDGFLRLNEIHALNVLFGTDQRRLNFRILKTRNGLPRGLPTLIGALRLPCQIHVFQREQIVGHRYGHRFLFLLIDCFDPIRLLSCQIHDRTIPDQY